jgi:hypothetical protein
MAVALVQEFPVDPSGDRSTTNYDAMQARLDTRNDPPEGGIFSCAGFDEEAGVFRIFAVWETQEAAERFLAERVMPLANELVASRPNAGPPQQHFYELHDVMTG